MKERSFDEMIAYFNRKVAEMDIAEKYKMALLGMIGAIEYKHEKEAQRWIPCSERLPKVGQDVLFSVQDLFVSEGCIRDDGDWSQFRWQAIQKKEAVTAWMPLPEPWRGEEHD